MVMPFHNHCITSVIGYRTTLGVVLSYNNSEALLANPTHF